MVASPENPVQPNQVPLHNTVHDIHEQKVVKFWMQQKGNFSLGEFSQHNHRTFYDLTNSTT